MIRKARLVRAFFFDREVSDRPRVQNFLTLIGLFFFLEGSLLGTPQASLVEIDAFLVDHYYDREFIEEVWPQTLKRARKRVAEASDETKGYKAIQEALNEFAHSHMAFYPPWNPWASVLSGRRGGWEMDFELYLIEGALRVGFISEEGPSRKAGLRAGMKVLSIDGVESKEILQRRAPLFEAYRLVDRCPWGKLDLIVEGRPHPKRRGDRLSIQLKKDTRAQSRFGHVAFPRDLKVKARSDGVLYAAFNAFTFDQVKEVKKAIQSHRGGRGVILDLRGNPGGVGALGPAIALEFCAKAYSFGSMKGRDMNLRFPVFPQAKVHPGPVAILVDGRSLSTSEITARGMQLEGSAKIFGQRTPGMALPSLILKLKDGSRFQYPVADFQDESGVSLEGRGVEPDVEIPMTLKDVLENRDPTLEGALDWILEKEE